jgi:dienelactone hydrolase
MLHGFSAGAQFSHRFAFKNPDLVAAVSAHPAGEWAQIEGEDRINRGARSIPFAVSCGEADTEKRYLAAPPRIEGFRTFAAQLLTLGFNVQVSSWPGVGHTRTDEVKAMAFALLQRVRKASPPTEP